MSTFWVIGIAINLVVVIVVAYWAWKTWRESNRR